jgi:hypothetical protein
MESILDTPKLTVARLFVARSSLHHRYFLCTGQAVTADHLSEHPASHIIGELCFRLYDGKQVTALARWDVSIKTQDPLPADPEIDVYLIGDAKDIKCRASNCKNKTGWRIGKAAIQQILRKYVPE